MKNPLAVILRTCAAGALAMLLAANASAGVVFRGAIDPIFGVFIPGASFTGEAFFDVDPDCLAVDGVYDNNDSCGVLTVLSANITLVNGSNSQTLDFTPNLLFTDPVINYLIQNGTLAAVDTTDIGPQFVTASPAVGYEGPMWLNLGTAIVGGEVVDQLSATANLLTGSCPEGCFASHDAATSSNIATVEITQVPEPATVALLLTALAACWVARRRPSRR